jgi:uncharacterized membrane protein (UPF0127 family)
MPKRHRDSHKKPHEVALEKGDGTLACERCLVADSAPARLRGLLGRPPLQRGQGLLLRPAGAIHTCFMRSEIDAVFLDRDLVVLHVASNIRPWRFAARRGSRAVLELSPGEGARRRIEPGSQLRVRANGSEAP